MIRVKVEDDSTDFRRVCDETDSVVQRSGIHHVLGGDLDLKRVGEQVKDKRHVDVAEVNEVLDFLFVNEIDVVGHLVTEEPGVVELVADDLESQEVWFAPVAHAGRVEVEVVQLIHEQRRVVQTLLRERVVLEVVPAVKGFDVVVLGALAVKDILVNVLGELQHARTPAHQSVS